MAEFLVKFANRNARLAADPGCSLQEVQVADEKEKKESVESAEALKATLNSICQQLNSVANELKLQRENVLAIAYQYAESFAKIVCTEDTGVVQSRLKTCLESGLAHFEWTGEIVVWVHADYRDFIEQLLAEKKTQDIEVRADPLLATCDCRIEGPHQGLIARLEKQLVASRKTILEELEQVRT